MSADFSRLAEVFGEDALKAHAERDGLTGLARAVFLARGGHAPGARCPSEPPPEPQHMYYCSYGIAPEDAEFGQDGERCICGALTHETSRDS